jgi:succinate dehydrogenase / fumarate reductase cytochrome b subunit
MAATGAVLFLFLIGHMVGNLQIFLGPDQINTYAHFLQSKGGLLWLVRATLLLFLLLHVWSAIQVSRENKAARPVGYLGNPAPVATTFASRTLLMSGLIIAAFVVYHILHFTVQVKALNLTGEDFVALHDDGQRHDVYRMMVVGFRQPIVSGFYILAMALLGLHLSHGLSSMFQTVGLRNKAWGAHIDRFAQLAAIAIFVGNCSIPVAILARWLK